MNKFDDIIPPSRRKNAVEEGATPRQFRRSRFPFATVIIILVIIAISIGFLIHFESAKVEVVPDTVQATVQTPMTATTGTGSLPFLVITSKKIATQDVAGSGTKEVDSAASGKITIYNTTNKAQTLVKQTRFATPSGLIFKIQTGVTIPAGSPSKPGEVTAAVTAAQSGATYNVDPTSFTVPGLAGTALSSSIYAKSTSAMTGGASGLVPTVDPDLESQTNEKLQAALAPDLASTLSTQIPQGYVLIPGAATTTFQSLAPQTSSTTGMVTLREQGVAQAVVFPNTSLAQSLAQTLSGLATASEPLKLASTTGLQLAFTSPFPDDNTPSITFSVSGTASFIYVIDPERIATAVAGKTRSAAEVALSNFVEVKSAMIVLRPFWRKTFPLDPNAIAVVVEKS